MRILLVEDDPQLGDGLTVGLRQAGFAVDWLKDGNSADHALQSETFDFVVLDLGLPRLSGMEVLTRARSRGQIMPILILTARDATGDKVSGLDAGADDYLPKPFSRDELLARVRALLRRGHAGPTSLPARTIGFGDIEVDLAARRVRRAGVEVSLATKEFEVLRLLVQRPREVVTRQQFLDLVWGWAAFPTTRTVDKHVAALRQKLEAQPAAPRWIQTVHGVGYRLDLPG